MKFSRFVQILEENGFELDRTSGSHRQYQGFVDGHRRLVTVAAHRLGADIKPRNLASMIRQSGLPKRLFR